MNWLDVVSLLVGVTGIAAAVWFYYHLWKWSRDCQQATIAIAYKRKVVMTPTLVELLLWSRKVPDKQNGQVFYKAPNVTVAIIKRDRRSWRTRRQINERKRMPRAQSQAGTWSNVEAKRD